MSAPAPDLAAPSPGPPDAAAAGERIEHLLEAMAAAGPVARERAEELVRIVVDLYGAGLERLLEIAYEAGALDDALLDQFAADDLVSSLLIVHGLHPYGVPERVERALAAVRPALGSHGDVRLIEVTGEGTVRLQQLASCDGCASSATLDIAIEDAIRCAAPEIIEIELVERVAEPGDTTVIPVEQLTSRLHRDLAGRA